MGESPLTLIKILFLEKASPSHVDSGFFLFLAATLLIGLPANAQDPIVQSMTITGNSFMSTNEILRGFITQPIKPYQVPVFQKDLENLTSTYHQRGYTFFQILRVDLAYTSDSSRVEISVAMDEGRPAVVGGIDVRGVSLSRNEAEDALGFGIGDRFVPRMLEDGIRGLLMLFEQRGFPFAKAAVENVVFISGEEVDSVHIVLAMSEEGRIELSEVRIEGTTVTKDFVIEREVRLSDKKNFSEAFAEDVKRRLERLQLFSSVALPELYVTEQGKGGLLIKVRESSPNRFDGIVGYVPSAGTQEKGYLTGLLDLQFGNLFGTGRRLWARWKRETETTQDLALRYREPWIASWPINAELGFAQRRQDSTYLRREYDFSGAYMVTAELSLGLLLNQASVYPGERLSQPAGRSTTVSVGGSIRYDSRDDQMTPSQGLLYYTSYELGRKSFATGGRQQESQTSRLIFDLEYYVSAIQRQVVFGALHARDIQSPILEQGDAFRVGGARTLRGYRESQFLGSRMVWLNLEYRFLAGSRSFLFGFLDAGYIVVPAWDAVSEKNESGKAGYGVGVRVDSPVGLLGFTLGFGEGDTFRTAKLHLRLINEF